MWKLFTCMRSKMCQHVLAWLFSSLNGKCLCYIPKEPPSLGWKYMVPNMATGCSSLGLQVLLQVIENGLHLLWHHGKSQWASGGPLAVHEDFNLLVFHLDLHNVWKMFSLHLFGRWFFWLGIKDILFWLLIQVGFIPLVQKPCKKFGCASVWYTLVKMAHAHNAQIATKWHKQTMHNQNMQCQQWHTVAKDNPLLQSRGARLNGCIMDGNI